MEIGITKAGWGAHCGWPAGWEKIGAGPGRFGRSVIGGWGGRKAGEMGIAVLASYCVDSNSGEGGLGGGGHCAFTDLRSDRLAHVQWPTQRCAAGFSSGNRPFPLLL